MKTKRAYIFLVLGIMALIGVAAFLTQMLISLQTPDKIVVSPPKRRDKPVPGAVTAVSETKIVLDKSSPGSGFHPATEWRKPHRAAGKSSFAPPPPSDRPGIGTVSTLKGTAFVIRGDRKRIPVTADMRIETNDRIETGRESGIQVMFDDGSIVSQGENSAIAIDEFLYNPDTPEENGLTMRMIKGICRSVTGMITNLNPDRFKVRTRMATIGVRGCELIFQSSSLSELICVLDLGGEKTVWIKTTNNGSPVLNPEDGTTFVIDKSITTQIDIMEPGKAIALNRGRPPEQRNIANEDIRKLLKQSSALDPAKYEVHQQPGGMVFNIRPPEQTE